MARIRLLFGNDSDAVRPAENLLVELDVARGAATKVDSTFAWQKLEKVYGLHKEFQVAAFEQPAVAGRQEPRDAVRDHWQRRGQELVGVAPRRQQT